MLKKIIAMLLTAVIILSTLPFSGAQAFAAADGVGYYRIQTQEDNLRIRRSPSTGSTVLGSIPKGTVVEVTEVSGDWGKVSYNGVTGWINLDYAVKTTSSASSDTPTTPSAIRDRLDKLREKFPHGKYWNHYGSSSKNPDGWTNTPCPSGHYLNGVQQCNGQCDGFAKKLGVDLFGLSTSKWEKVSYDIDTICVGDIIRYNGKHTIMVVGFTQNRDQLIIADCNWDYHCGIRWDALFKTSRYFSTVNWVLHYPGNYYNRDVYLGKSPESAAFSQSSYTINEGGCLTLPVTMTPNCPGAQISWVSSDTTVAAVDKNGKVTAKKPGVTTITYKADNAVATCTVKVTGRVDISRISGSDRIATATAIAATGWTAGAQSVVLANSRNFADALAGVPLAKVLDAPILLTGGKSLEAEVLGQITALDATKVYILGGSSAVSESAEDALSDAGLATERIAGDTRFETSVRIAEKMAALGAGLSELFVANGYSFADALSAGPAAGLGGSPIIYVLSSGELPAAVKDYLSDSDVKKAVIIGGEKAVGNDVAAAVAACGLDTPERLFGDNRYATCLAVIKKYSGRFSGSDLALATGADFPDALAGGAFAAKLGIPLLLAAPTAPADILGWVSGRNPGRLYVFGGTGAVSDQQVYEYTV